jgi:hypothetical protein
MHGGVFLAHDRIEPDEYDLTDWRCHGKQSLHGVGRIAGRIVTDQFTLTFLTGVKSAPPILPVHLHAFVRPFATSYYWRYHPGGAVLFF